ncbi:hypothetical protein VIBHAR_04789 [Vibrio campbellii ATCC BAA-1116]|uniref:Uncharacterized protein n=1 Tax=Vibrio campbellii (strain ATCC BAA-1116) TaxID=2902295 RepID=A7N5U8_VIBC1|nr:hypothetical protein VIBHAR_04789 [Vibrio campbellii ATCC BAA-1116]
MFSIKTMGYISLITQINNGSPNAILFVFTLTTISTRFQLLKMVV